MRIAVVSALAFVALAAAERDWSKIINMDLQVKGRRIPHKPSIRITNGNEVVPHSRPYQAGLFIYIPVLGATGFCGGTLIDEQNILTAAHCVSAADGPIEVVLGAHNITEEEATQVVVYSSDYLHHNASDIAHDIGLIRLPRPVAFNEYIQPIPVDNSSCIDDYVGREATASGWGLHSDSDSSDTPTLREVTMPVISNSECAEYYAEVIQPTHICTETTGGKSTCGGDSGGPLVLDDVQVGIISFGSSAGCEAGWPAAFVRACKFSSWIEENKKQ